MHGVLNICFTMKFFFRW